MSNPPDNANAALSIKSREEPGFFDLLAADTSPGEDEFRPAAERFLGDPQVSNTDLAKQLSQEIPPDVSTEDFRDTWNAIKKFIKPIEVVIVGEETKDVPLEAYWLTLPKISGASVTMSSSSSRSDETSGSLTIFGVGGGPTFTLAISQTLEFEADDQQRVDLLAPGTFERVQCQKGEQVLADFVRLRSVATNNVRVRRLPADPPSPSSWSPVQELPFDLARVDDLTRHTLTVTEGTTSEIGVTLSLEKLGMEASIGATVAYEQELSYTNELPGGHDYVASSYSEFPAYIWQLKL